MCEVTFRSLVDDIRKLLTEETEANVERAFILHYACQCKGICVFSSNVRVVLVILVRKDSVFFFWAPKGGIPGRL
jgi:hypothetical protein